MQIKTIKKAIESKMNAWLLSITDESLRGKVKDSLLVSGGSICSMLLNTEVNDFDVYLKDINVLIDLAKYYSKPFTNIQIMDGSKKAEYISEIESEYRTEIGLLNNAKAISVRNLKDGQVKLFFDEKNGGMKVNEDVEESKLNFTPLFFSPNAISLSDKLQIVLRFTGDADAIHETFDFIHATNYFTFENGLSTNKEALESILTKQLKYQGSQYPLTSIIRMKKFVIRGWNINAGEILKIMFQISELDLKNPDVLEEQLIGVDVAYFAVLISALRGVDGNKITSQYINAIIDKVFNDCDDSTIK